MYFAYRELLNARHRRYEGIIYWFTAAEVVVGALLIVS